MLKNVFFDKSVCFWAMGSEKTAKKTRKQEEMMRIKEARSPKITVYHKTI
ncbi:hypothetical protein GGR22_001413 [Flavobacterium gossypii]|uniref:Uncharacterized protein n=1 Tax=Flavobacterium gossypii TaxID=1646119 RepID=A0ABR6DNL0_9FLAO|nr:hypothetical protein [Flavobacterium gossypii]